ncbi:MAG: hypothetical protein J6C40_15270, partial [Lentisphaeria bacterium]|nr:hypothetical protein [Lentisphaeria bacterium]
MDLCRKIEYFERKMNCSLAFHDFYGELTALAAPGRLAMRQHTTINIFTITGWHPMTAMFGESKILFQRFFPQITFDQKFYT